MKINKGQVLAVLALGLALGLAMPAAAYAEEVEPTEPTVVNVDETDGAEGEPETQAEESTVGGGVNDGEEAVSQDVAENLTELVGRIKERESFADYRKVLPMVKNATTIEAAIVKVEDLPDDNGFFTWEGLSDEEKTAMQGKTLYEAVQYIKEQPIYTSNTNVKMMVDAILETVDTAKAALIEEVKVNFPDKAAEADEMSLAELVETAKSYTSYADYAALAAAMTKIDGFDAGEDGLTEDEVKGLYNSSEAAMMLAYNAIATAALKIDETVMDGLMSYELPETSAPESPNTGSVDAYDVNALDMALITTLAAGSLATLGGAALVAKLYLCHKF